MKRLLLFFTVLGAAYATPLTGSGPNMALPSTGAVPPGVAPTIATGSGVFSGTWAAPAAGPWHGTFTATGSYPSSGFTGSSVWDFTGLNAGELPSGTYFRLSDLDNGESLVLRAYGPGNVQITGAWLDQPVFLSGANPLELVAGSMPGWSFSGGEYTFTGSNVAGNPTVLVSLLSNEAISFLEVDKDFASNGFGLAAPTPEPGTFLLLGFASAVLLFLRRRRVQAIEFGALSDLNDRA